MGHMSFHNFCFPFISQTSEQPCANDFMVVLHSGHIVDQGRDTNQFHIHGNSVPVQCIGNDGSNPADFLTVPDHPVRCILLPEQPVTFFFGESLHLCHIRS